MGNVIEFSRLTWIDIEERLADDKRVVIPLGATEEHAYLSLATDTIVAEKVSKEACQRANVLLAPAMPFGCSAFAINYPGTISMRTQTMCNVVEDIIDCLYRQGFRRLIFVTGHGGNEVITGVLSEGQLDRPGLVINYLDAWSGMEQSMNELEALLEVPRAEHAAWYEDFPFTRVRDIPDLVKSPPSSVDFPGFPLNPRTARKYLEEGIVSGKFVVDHDTTEKLFQQCVEHLTAILTSIPKEAPSL